MVSVYFDVSDLYYRVRKKYNKKVNYKALMGLIAKQFGEIDKAEAYGCQVNEEAKSFISHLRSNDILVKYRRPKVFKVKEQDIKSCNWNVEIVISAICSDSKTLVFCSSNTDLIPLYKHLQNMCKKVVVIGCSIPESVKNTVDVYLDIDKSCLN